LSLMIVTEKKKTTGVMTLPGSETKERRGGGLFFRATTKLRSFFILRKASDRLSTLRFQRGRKQAVSRLTPERKKDQH